MFRSAAVILLFASLAGLAFSDQAPLPVERGNRSVTTSNDPMDILQDHMRSQLDWRSYFTLRMEARRRSVANGQPKLAQHPVPEPAE